MKFQCRYCKKSFVRENTLAVHVCEQKKRYQSQNETGVQIGLNAYLLLYKQIAQQDLFAAIALASLSLQSVTLPEDVAKSPSRVTHFEKDDDNNFHVDFIAACANLKARMFHITPAQRIMSIIKLMVYMTAGPKYILTRLTSSLMRFIKSPVLF